MSNAVMLVNVVEEEEARIAILEEGKLEELYVERASGDRIVANIYKGAVVNIASNIEAAFVEFGYRKHGFLHVSDVRPSIKGDGAVGGRDDRARHGPLQKLLSPGDEIIVQVTKEGIGEKGPALTTYLSIPGRHLVLMPGVSLNGVSRRIEDQAERTRLRGILKQVETPPGVGVIVRTAGAGASEKQIRRDLDYLLRLWNTIKKRTERPQVPALLYQESDLVIRVIRDVFRDDIRKIVVDSKRTHARVREFLRDVMPHHVRKVKLHEGSDPLYHQFGVEQELAAMHSRKVNLPSGGSIVLDQTEALVAIDVNSSQFKGKGDAEATAFKINMEAAVEIARQIRLRDLGGVLVIDFIDIQDRKRRSEVEKALRTAFQRDKARLRVLRMSAFCIVEMTRQRRRASLRQAHYAECPICHGRGQVRSPETVALDLIRKLRAGLSQRAVARAEVDVSPAIANYLNNAMRSRLQELEDETNKQILIRADASRGPDEYEELFLKDNGAKVSV